jgi:26S proteasome regulatory subunit N10
MIASMALKYRSNKVQKQKIVAFICSPLSQTDIKLIPEIAKILKKALIGLDIVNLLESNKAFLVSLVDQVNVSGNSNIIDCSGKGMAISDAVLASPIASQGNAPQMMNPENNGGNVNFQEDPELAEAIRMSLAEAQRKEEVPKKQASEPKEAKAKEPAKEEPVIEELTEEEMMKKALEMSMQIPQPQPMEEVKMPSETDALLDPEFLQDAIKKITGTSLTKEEVIVWW